MRYFVNTDAREDGTRVVHDEACQYLPKADNRDEIGAFDHCAAALDAARQSYDRVKACATCSSDCA